MRTNSKGSVNLFVQVIYSKTDKKWIYYFENQALTNFNVFICKMLNNSKRINMKTLVIGASLKEDRYSNKAIKALRKHDIETVAFGMRAGTVLDVDIDTELKPYENLHTVALYLNPKRQMDYYNYITDLKPNRVIFNPGTENPEFYELLEKHNITYEVACTLVLLATNQYKS